MDEKERARLRDEAARIRQQYGLLNPDDPRQEEIRQWCRQRYEEIRCILEDHNSPSGGSAYELKPPPLPKVVPPLPPRTISKPRNLRVGHDPRVPTVNVHLPVGSSGLSVASLVLGIIAFALCWIPLVGCAVYPLSLLGMALGVVGLIQCQTRHSSGTALSVTGIVLSGIAFVVPFLVMSLLTSSLPEPDLSFVPAEFRISASQLYREFDENEVRADMMYDGSVLEVTGVVDEVATDVIGKPYVALEGGEYFGSIQCYFGTDDAFAIAGLSKGDTVTVKGRCDGKVFNILLRDCIVVSR